MDKKDQVVQTSQESFWAQEMVLWLQSAAQQNDTDSESGYVISGSQCHGRWNYFLRGGRFLVAGSVERFTLGLDKINTGNILIVKKRKMKHN